jgi:predicted phosphodiesterase
VSDFHLGAVHGRDLLRDEVVLAALIDSLADVDHLVLLGDVVELREASIDEIVAAARPALSAIGGALTGRRITLVPGNHDYQLARPLLEELRVRGAPLELENAHRPPAGGALGAVTAPLAAAELRIAYPGVWVREDVYATHGHYLDLHNTVPTFERLAIHALQRVTRGVPSRRARPEDYEAALAPIYDLSYALAQGDPAGRRYVRSNRTLDLWRSLNADGRAARARRLGARAGLALAVGALNAAGLGPFKADLSPPELRRSSLRAIATVAERLGVDAAHVIFGHSHRSGPHPGDEPWTFAGGGSLMNPGSWRLEPQLLGRRPEASPYYPGHCIVVGDSGAPELHRVLPALPARAAAALRGT